MRPGSMMCEWSTYHVCKGLEVDHPLGAGDNVRHEGPGSGQQVEVTIN